MRHAAERGHLVVGVGDFNMIPLSLAHRLIETHAPVRDVWRVLHPDSAIGSSHSYAEKARGRAVPTADEAILEHGATCDSNYNTWRWNKQRQKKLAKGEDTVVDGTAPDPNSQRLDYVFFGGDPDTDAANWNVETVNVGMTGRHPELMCSLSDHFSVEATITKQVSGNLASNETAPQPAGLSRLPTLPLQTYDEILAMIRSYDARERRQRRLRLSHFVIQVLVSIGWLVASWFSPGNFVCFILMLVSTLGFGAGILDGLMGGLFVSSELRALKEFKWEIETARVTAEELQGRAKSVPDDLVEQDVAERQFH